MAVRPSRERARLAKAVADFWDGGAGPTHGDVTEIFAVVGIADIDLGSKKDRVSEALRTVPDQDLFTLVDLLIESLRTVDLPDATAATINRLRDALRPFGFRLSDTFDLSSQSGPGADRLPDLPALREHVDRIERAIRDDDKAQLLGSTKEMLESVAKHVVHETGGEAPLKFPGLLTAAFEALDLHPKSITASDPEVGAATKKILGGALQIVLGIDELRNTHGTGHGRVGPPPRLGSRHARLAAGAGVTVAALLLDTLEDPSAPWARNAASGVSEQAS